MCLLDAAAVTLICVGWSPCPSLPPPASSEVTPLSHTTPWHDGCRYWMTAGAVPTPKVQDLFARVGLLPKLPEPPIPKRNDPRGVLKWQTGLKD